MRAGNEKFCNFAADYQNKQQTKMKKTLFLAVVMMASALNASAQYEPGTFSLQVKAGVTVSSLSNATDIQVGTLQNSLTYMRGLPANILETTLEKHVAGGGTVGVDIEYQAAKWLGLSLGVGYISQGVAWDDFKFKQDGVKFRIEDPNTTLGYVNVPVVANFYLYKGLALKSGVQLAFLTYAHHNARVTANGNREYMQADMYRSVKSHYESFDIAIPVGVSYEFSNHVVLDARYNIGIKPVNKEPNPGGSDNKNQCFAFTVGYKFKL